MAYAYKLRPPSHEYNSWLLEQIYTTPESSISIGVGGVVPNVDDSVVKWDGDIKKEYRVVSIDENFQTTMIPVTVADNTFDDIVTGAPVGVGALSGMAELLLNPSDPKLSCVINNRLPISGANLSYAKIFAGSNIAVSGEILSISYDLNGNPLDDKIQLTPREEGSSEYVPRPGNFDRLVEKDQVVTMVIYNDTDVVAYYQQLVVKHSHIVANVQANALFINDLYFVSPYVNPLKRDELHIPKHLLTQSFNPRIFVEYQTGQTREVFEGSSNVNVFGWKDHVVDNENEKFPLVLTYSLTAGERSTIIDPEAGNRIIKHYDVIVVGVPQEANVKLFVLPIWVDQQTGYRLEFWVYNLFHDTVINVTNDVTNENNFNGLLYDVKQTLELKLALNSVNPAWPIIDYVDTIELELVGEPLTASTSYRLWYYRDDSRWFGEDLRVRIVNDFGSNTLTLNNDITQKSQWLEELYYRACPLYNPSVENDAPAPTAVEVIIDGNTITIDVDTYWNGAVPFTNAMPSNGSTATLVWYYINESSARLDLARTTLPIELV